MKCPEMRAATVVIEADIKTSIFPEMRAASLTLPLGHDCSRRCIYFADVTLIIYHSSSILLPIGINEQTFILHVSPRQENDRHGVRRTCPNDQGDHVPNHIHILHMKCF